MTNLLDRFIPEAREYLASSASCLLKLERDPSDEGLINEVFRAVHTLKGSSGLFDLPGLTRLVHAAEDLLVTVRAGELRLDSEMVDLLLDSLDKVSGWIDELERHGKLPGDAEGVSVDLSRKLRAKIPDDKPKDTGGTVAKPSAASDVPPDWLGNFPEADRLAAVNAICKDGPPLLAINYMPDESCFYRGEDPVNLFRQLTGLMAFLPFSPHAPPSLAEVDPFQSSLGFHALVVQPRSEIEHLFRYVIEQVSITAIGPNALIAPTGDVSSAPVHKNVADDARKRLAVRLLAAQRRILSLAGKASDSNRPLTGIEATVSAILLSLNLSLRQGELVAAAKAASDCNPAPLEGLLSALEHRIEAQVVPPIMVSVTEAESAVSKTRQIAHVLKVDQAKVDALMNLIAELVVSKNSLPFLAKRAEEVYGSRDMSREIKDQYAVIDRLAQELQRSIMDVRMLPVSEIFERFPRLIRDLARKLDKQIDLKIIGEETAADKNIIEALGDPLIHLVRNSIDHGIELPAERGKAGKPETATIQLKAYQEGNQVIIEISDDGKGIDPAVIRVKAIEKGLITEEKADSMSDQEAINLVFLPGFSMAKEISDLSGRGVGMDVVRTAIEKVNGHVTLSSTKGEGTLVRLMLPLSMAVTRVMMVEVSGGVFGIPMDGVAETVKIPRKSIRNIKGSEVFVLRDAVVPIVRMNRLLAMPDAPEAAEEEAILVARVAGNMVGLVIDRFREGIDVVLKPLGGLLAGMRGYVGSALLGDGRVLLVLNLKELL